MIDTSVLNNPQSISALRTALYFLLGIPLLGLWGYMFDQVRKAKAQADPTSSLVSFYKTLFKFFYIAPFQYLHMSIKNRDAKGIFVFVVTVGLTILAMNIGNLAVAFGK